MGAASRQQEEKPAVPIAFPACQLHCLVRKQSYKLSYLGLAAIHSSCLRLSSSDLARLLSSAALNEESIAF